MNDSVTLAPPDWEEETPSPLLLLQGKSIPITKDSSPRDFWDDLLSKPMEKSANGTRYLRVRNTLAGGPTSLIYRKCYPHMIDRIIYCWNHENRQCLVTGTPGIGKTIFGFFLIRHLWTRNLANAIVCVIRKWVYVITNDPAIRGELGIGRQTVTLYSSQENMIDVLLQDKRFVVLHDPERDASNPSTINDPMHAPCRVFILSFGHKYIDHFKSKNEGPPMRHWFYAPLWNQEEGRQCKDILQPFPSVEDAISVFGGSVRKWVQPDSAEAYQELKKDLASHIKALVKRVPKGDLNTFSDGDGFRGMVVQIEVPFDENAAPWPAKELSLTGLKPAAASISDGGIDGNDDEFEDETGVRTSEESTRNTFQQRVFHLGSALKPAAASISDGGIDGNDDDFVDETGVPTSEESTPNTFQQKVFHLGSAFIFEKLMEASLNEGKDQHSALLAALKNEKAFEDMYGRIFEPYCHNLLKDGCQLRIRRLTRTAPDGASEETEAQIDLPKLEKTFRFDGHDPKALKELEAGWCSHGSYIQPYSTSFPTYDSFFVVKENVLRPTKTGDKLIALNFQMTVSGATGLPPRPKHALRRYIRWGINAVCKEAREDFLESVTVFAVPNVCFESIGFQKEYIKDAKTFSKTQPKEQFVVEVPESVFPIERIAKRRKISEGEDEAVPMKD